MAEGDVDYEQLRQDAVEAVSILSSKEVLKREIKWGGFSKARLIDGSMVKDIAKYDNQGTEIKAALLEKDGQRYADIFLTLLYSINKPEVHQYVLALIDELLTEDDERIKYFLASPFNKGKDIEGEEEEDEGRCAAFGLFAGLLQSSDDPFVAGKSVKIYALLLTEFHGECDDEAEVVIRWCLDRIDSNGEEIADVSYALSGIQTILKKKSYRPIFAAQRGVKVIAGVMQKFKDKQQIMYQCLYCFWLASFDRGLAKEFYKIKDLIKDIIDAIRKMPKIKIRRIALATMRNLSLVKKNSQRMIELGFMRVLTYLIQNKWGDEDIVVDLEALTEKLQKDVIELTSFDMYKKEVMQGKLAWSPVHKTEKFWKENISRFEENNWEVIQVLLDIIRNEKDPKKIAIACFDIGEFVRFHPRGRKLISDLKGKTDIMMLMASHSDDQVQKHALLCVQKMIVTNWEYLAREN